MGHSASSFYMLAARPKCLLFALVELRDGRCSHEAGYVLLD
jgi:hypothetical protein